MKENIKKQILNLFPSKELEIALNTQDYFSAEMILAELSIQLDIFDEPSAIFNMLVDDIKNKNIEGLKITLNYAVTQAIILKIINIVEYYKKIKDGEIAKTDDLLDALRALNRFEEFKDMDINEFIKSIYNLKEDDCRAVECFETVLNIPLLDDLADAYESLADYIEALIYTLEISVYDVFWAVVNNDAAMLVNKILVIAFLKSKYDELKRPYVEQLQRKIDTIKSIGLNRGK